MRLLVFVLLLLLPRRGRVRMGRGRLASAGDTESFPIHEGGELADERPPVSEYRGTASTALVPIVGVVFGGRGRRRRRARVGGHEGDPDRKVVDLMRRVLKAQTRLCRGRARREEPAKTLEARARILPRATSSPRIRRGLRERPEQERGQVEKARLEREKKVGARRARDAASSPAAGAPRRRRRPPPAPPPSAVASAARDARCDVRALTRDAVRRLARHGDASVSEDLVEDRVRLQAPGPPLPMKAFGNSPSPQGAEKGVRAAERDGESG